MVAYSNMAAVRDPEQPQPPQSNGAINGATNGMSTDESTVVNGHVADEGAQSTKDDEGKDQEFVFIHDTGFNVKICPPGTEQFDIQVSATNSVVAIDRTHDAHRTS